MTNTTNLKTIPSSVLCDFYKITHRLFYPEGTTEIYSTWTPRSSKYFPVKTDYAVAFGFQMFVKKYLIEYFDTNFFSRTEEEVVSEYEYVIENTLGGTVDSSHIKALHKLGYLPLEIKAVPEGLLVPIKVPTLTINNTHPEFYWLTNYLETLMSSELWLPSNSATIANKYKADLEGWALFTTGSSEGVEWQGHDFSFRGMQGLNSSVSSGLGHLLSFKGTDNIPAIVGAEVYYNTKLSNELVGSSVPATEHSIMSSFGKDEVKAFDTIIDRVPTGIVSIVSDTYDFWGVMTDVLPTLKNKIMNRDGKVVIRPDSGNPIDIICGTTPITLNLNPHYIEGKNSVTDYPELILDAIKTSEKGQRHPTAHMVKSGANILLGNDVYIVMWERNGNGEFNIKLSEAVKKEESPRNKGAIRLLWETFGGTITEKGYRLLDSHIGLLYGDAITLDRANEICERLANNGFASTNVVFGIGSFTYTFVTRDSLGYALKATYAKINGVETFIQKDPKTDTAKIKKSLTGKVAVVIDKDSEEIKVIDHLTDEQEKNYQHNLLRTIFKDGKLYNEVTLQDVKDNLRMMM